MPDQPHTDVVSRRGLLGRGIAVAGAVSAAPLVASGTAAAAPSRRRPAMFKTDPAAPDYLGYRRADYERPFAKYFTETAARPQAHVLKALKQPPTDPSDIPALADLAAEINQPGYSKVETGYGDADGANWSATLTRMPGVTPAMWDWWFGWHSAEPARYKLWHPEAHLHASLLKPLADEPGLTDKERYIGNTSYADEYLPDYHGARRYLGDGAGGILIGPGITFVDPAGLGIDVDAFHGTAICGRGGPQGEPDTTTLFVHQVRPVKGGSEMRSRFYVNGAPATGVRPKDPAAAAAAKARAPLPSAANFQGFFNMFHAGVEMHHLARFLPALRADVLRRRRRHRGH